MKMKVNRSMLELLGGDAEFYEPSSIVTPDSLIAWATAGFKEIDGCVVPASFSRAIIWSSARPRILNTDDETGFECSLSKIHVEDYFETDIGLVELARTGVDFGFLLGTELLKTGIGRNFRTIVSAHVADPDMNVKEACTVRYHKVREGQIWLDDDLEAYKHEAIAALDFAV
jgi:hypothetical protein